MQLSVTHTILGALWGAVLTRRTGVTVGDVLVTSACCYGTPGAGGGLVATFWTIVADWANSRCRVRLNGASIAVVSEYTCKYTSRAKSP